MDGSLGLKSLGLGGKGPQGGAALLPAHIPRQEVPNTSQRRADHTRGGAWHRQSGILPGHPRVRERRRWGCRVTMFLLWLELRQDVGSDFLMGSWEVAWGGPSLSVLISKGGTMSFLPSLSLVGPRYLALE